MKEIEGGGTRWGISLGRERMFNGSNSITKRIVPTGDLKGGDFPRELEIRKLYLGGKQGGLLKVTAFQTVGQTFYQGGSEVMGVCLGKGKRKPGKRQWGGGSTT